MLRLKFSLLRNFSIGNSTTYCKHPQDVNSIIQITFSIEHPLKCLHYNILSKALSYRHYSSTQLSYSIRQYSSRRRPEDSGPDQNPKDKGLNDLFSLFNKNSTSGFEALFDSLNSKNTTGSNVFNEPLETRNAKAHESKKSGTSRDQNNKPKSTLEDLKIELNSTDTQSQNVIQYPLIWDELPPQIRPIDVEKEWNHFRTTYSSIDFDITTMRSYDKASQSVRSDFDQHIHKLEIQRKVECNLFEDLLIKEHESAVKHHSWLIDYLDFSTRQKLPKPDDNLHPFLYNEKFHIGLTRSEFAWIRTRLRWLEAVNKKKTNVALYQRNLIKCDQMVDQLFMDALELLDKNSANKNSESNVQKSSTLTRAQEARARLEDYLKTIYSKHPFHWTQLLQKYLPPATGLAEKVNNRSFWTPNNPFLLVAFTKSLLNEAGAFQKLIREDPIEDEIEDDNDQNSEEDPHKIYKGHAMVSMSHMRSETIARDATLGGHDASFKCVFCGPHRHRFPLDPMNVPLMSRYMNKAGKIQSRLVTRLCRRHQLKMSRLIKYARHLNIFTYKKSLFCINNPFLPARNFDTPIIGMQQYQNPFSPRDDSQTNKFDDERNDAAVREDIIADLDVDNKNKSMDEQAFETMNEFIEQDDYQADS